MSQEPQPHEPTELIETSPQPQRVSGIRRIAGAGVIALAVLAAACGGGSDKDAQNVSSENISTVDSSTPESEADTISTEYFTLEVPEGFEQAESGIEGSYYFENSAKEGFNIFSETDYNFGQTNIDLGVITLEEIDSAGNRFLSDASTGEPIPGAESWVGEVDETFGVFTVAPSPNGAQATMDVFSVARRGTPSKRFTIVTFGKDRKSAEDLLEIVRQKTTFTADLYPVEAVEGLIGHSIKIPKSEAPKVGDVDGDLMENSSSDYFQKAIQDNDPSIFENVKPETRPVMPGDLMPAEDLLGFDINPDGSFDRKTSERETVQEVAKRVELALNTGDMDYLQELVSLGATNSEQGVTVGDDLQELVKKYAGRRPLLFKVVPDLKSLDDKRQTAGNLESYNDSAKIQIKQIYTGPDIDNWLNGDEGRLDGDNVFRLKVVSTSPAYPTYGGANGGGKPAYLNTQIDTTRL